MRNKILLGLLLSFFCTLPVFAQSAANRIDKKGRKQGPWEKFNPATGLRYQGEFKDDMPQGLFRYWNAGDTLVAEARYFREGYASYNRFYYPDGALMAEGYYLDKQKDSLWQYYAQDGRLLKSEHFEQGLPNGLRVIYNPDGTVSEKQTWFRNLRNGPWFIHDEAGYQLYNYKLNLTDGAYTALYPDSTRFIEGFYRDGIKQEKWSFYLPGGDLYKEDFYRDNRVVKRILYLRMNGVLRAVAADTVPVILTGRNAQAEIVSSSGNRYVCDERFETVCNIFDIDNYFYANKNTMVSFMAVDGDLLPEVLPVEAESEYYDGQSEQTLSAGNTSPVSQVRLPLKVRTPFPIFLDADGIAVLRRIFQKE